MRIKTVLCMLLLAPSLAIAQGPKSGVGADRPRSSYDPGATGAGKAQQQSGVAAALGKINPQEKDYGAVIGQGRMAVFEETVEDFYWWSCIVLTLLLMASVMYIVWLWRQLDLRLRISGDVVAQLYNSHVAARARATETIEKHNQLVRRYNAQSLEIVAMRAAEAQKDATKNAKDGLDAAEKLRSKPSKSASAPVPADQQVPPPSNALTDANVQEDVPGIGETEDISVLQEQVRQLTSQNKAQQKASEQKIANLRAQLGRAHHSLEEARNGAPASRPA